MKYRSYFFFFIFFNRELLLNDKRYIVPKIFEEYSTDKILTSEYLEGVIF